MREFSYVVKDELGIHARPAGELVKKAAKFNSKIMMSSGGKSVDIKKIFGVMSLCVKCGMEVTLNIEGEDEDLAADELLMYLNNNL